VLERIGDIDSAERCIALLARSFVDGTPYEIERLNEPAFREQNLRRKESLGEINH